MVNNKSWYNPQFNNVDNFLNNFEKQNAKFILSLEKFSSFFENEKNIYFESLTERIKTFEQIKPGLIIKEKTKSHLYSKKIETDLDNRTYFFYPNQSK